jgi:hypothetical protein
MCIVAVGGSEGGFGLMIGLGVCDNGRVSLSKFVGRNFGHDDDGRFRG